MEDLIALLEAAQDRDRVLDRRLVHLDGLEAALERGVLFDILAVLVERRRADAVQLAARQHGLEEVARVHAALGLARADDRVQLVDEEDDAALGTADLLEHGLESLLEFAAVLCAGDQRAHVEGEDRLVLQALRHVAADDALGQALGDGRLADARLADQHRVVFRLAREDADDVADLAVAADDGVKLVFAGALDQIRAVFRERVIGALRIVAGHGRGLDLGKLRGKGGLGDAVVGKAALDGGRGGGENADHQMLHRDIFVAHALRGLFGGVQRAVGLRREIDLRPGADLGQRGDRGVKLGEQLVAVHAHLAQQRRDQPAVLVDERIEQMLRRDGAVAVFLRHGFGGIESLQALLCIVLSIHVNTPC